MVKHRPGALGALIHKLNGETTTKNCGCGPHVKQAVAEIHWLLGILPLA